MLSNFLFFLAFVMVHGFDVFEFYEKSLEMHCDAVLGPSSQEYYTCYKRAYAQDPPRYNPDVALETCEKVTGSPNKALYAVCDGITQPGEIKGKVISCMVHNIGQQAGNVVRAITTGRRGIQKCYDAYGPKPDPKYQ